MSMQFVAKLHEQSLKLEKFAELLADLQARMTALESRLLLLEQKRGPGRPPNAGR